MNYIMPIKYSQNNYLLAALFLSLLIITGCTSSTISPSTLVQLKYGDSTSQVHSHIKKQSVRLFKFRTDNHRYYSELVALSRHHKYLVFLYQDDKLVSIITSDQGKSIWESVYGEYDKTPPNPNGFEAIIGRIIDERLVIAVNSFEKDANYQNSDNSGAAETLAAGITTGGASYAIVGPALPFLLAAGASVAIASGSSTYTRDEKFTRTTNAITLDDSLVNVEAIMQLPAKKIILDDQKIVVFDANYHTRSRNNVISIGLVSDKVKWIGYHYDAIDVRLHDKQPGIFGEPASTEKAPLSY